MITKTQYCKKILKDFCNSELSGIHPEDVTDWGPYIHMSSHLAIALEFLGKLTKDQMIYSSGRGGIVATYFDKDTKEVSILSLRELLSLLPD